jgi:hypothetical protein
MQDREAVIGALNKQAAAINTSLSYVLDRLRINAPHFVEILTSREGNIVRDVTKKLRF